MSPGSTKKYEIQLEIKQDRLKKEIKMKLQKNAKVIQNISGNMLNQKELVKNQLVT